jgi:phenylalanyl-tRNA synthetase beta chain
VKTSRPSGGPPEGLTGYSPRTMRTSITWLNDYLDPALDAQTQADLLTAAGFPYDGEDLAENGEAWQEIETTSNRGDCLCHFGLAREAALLGGSRLKTPEVSLPQGGPPVSESIEIRNTEPDLCPLYTGRVIRGVKVGPSPDWLQQRLIAIGLVPRNNLVDATNFVLFEYGQPTHVFDLDTLRGGRIEIRAARAGESFLPIGEDAEPIKLVPEDLVIADAERAIAIAGVKGGAETSVTDGTTNILLEAATFDPVGVRNTSRRHRLASDSSYRFERGVHPADIAVATDRLTALILELAGGELCDGTAADGKPIPSARAVSMRPTRCRAVLGIDISDQEIMRLLEGLGFAPNAEAENIRCTIPPRRLDIDREADLIEEIARTHGLDALPINETIRIRAVAPRPVDEGLNAVREMLVGAGFHESVTHTLIGPDAAAAFLETGHAVLTVDDDRAAAEPILRPSLVPSLLRVAKHNHDLGTSNVRFFETASVFDQCKGVHRERRLLGLLVDPPAGSRSRDHASLGQAAFGVLRTTIDRVVRIVGGGNVEIDESVNIPGFSSSGAIRMDGRVIGSLGVVDPGVAQRHGHDRPLVAAEIELAPDGVAEALSTWPPENTAAALPAFPAIDRDLTILIDEPICWAEIERAIHAGTPELLESTEFVTVFRGGKLPADRKAITLRLRFRAPDRTLRHEEVDPQMTNITARLIDAVGGEIRQ